MNYESLKEKIFSGFVLLRGQKKNSVVFKNVFFFVPKSTSLITYLPMIFFLSQRVPHIYPNIFNILNRQWRNGHYLSIPPGIHDVPSCICPIRTSCCPHFKMVHFPKRYKTHPNVHPILQKHVKQDSSTTSRAMKNSGQILSIPETF